MTTEKKKAYLRKYFLDHKEENRKNKRLNYWRNKARSLCEDEAIILSMNENSLKNLCNEHLALK